MGLAKTALADYIIRLITLPVIPLSGAYWIKVCLRLSVKETDLLQNRYIIRQTKVRMRVFAVASNNKKVRKSIQSSWNILFSRS